MERKAVVGVRIEHFNGEKYVKYSDYDKECKRAIRAEKALEYLAERRYMEQMINWKLNPK